MFPERPDLRSWNGLNWTKVGLKADMATSWGKVGAGLNWTKVGLKADNTPGCVFYTLACLNWTKVGLKVLTFVMATGPCRMFELD